MRHEGQVFLATPLDLAFTLRGIRLQCLSDRLIEHSVENVERLSLQVDAVVAREIVNTSAQDIVFRHDLFNVEGLFETLQAVGFRSPLI